MKTITFPRWPTWNFAFPELDVRAILAVRYFDAHNAECQLPRERWRLAIGRNGVSQIVLVNQHDLPATAERPDAVSVEYEGGTAAA